MANMDWASVKKKWNENIYSLQGALFLAGLYSFIHIAARLIASANLGEDDPLDNVLSQTLQWGYTPFQPPLYNWLLWALQQFIGTGVFPFLLIKYAALVATAGLLFHLTRKTTDSALWGLLAVDALALIYQISWRYHEGFTHLALAMPIALAIVWTWLRMLEKEQPKVTDYLLVGGFMGLGLLTGYIFWLLLVGLILASLRQADFRRKMTSSRMLFSIGISLCFAAPFYFWIYATPEAWEILRANIFKQNRVSGLVEGLGNPFLFLMPYLAILPIMFPSIVKPIWASITSHTAPESASVEIFLRDYFIIGVGLLIIFGVLTGWHGYAPHALNPLFLIFVVWLSIQLSKANISQGQIGRFVILTVGITLFAFGARMANMFVYDPVCKKCRWGIPYETLADKIKTRKIEYLLVKEKELAGNLRTFVPDSKILLLDKRYSQKLVSSFQHSKSSEVALVWSERRTNISQRKKVWSERFFPALRISLVGPPTKVVGKWQHLWKPDGYRLSEWYIQKIKVTKNDFQDE